MLVPIALDRLPQFAGLVAARVRHWSPLRQRVMIRVEDAVDDQLIDCELTGEISGYDPALRGTPLLISLDRKLRYEDSHTYHLVDVIVAVAALRWHAPERLVVTWNAVRLIDASSFADCRFRPTIGTARLTRR